MPLIDRTPGGFIAFANVIVYGVVGAEIWMWTVASTAAIAVTLALIAALAGVICAAVLRGMDDEPVPVAATLVAVPAPASAVPQPVREVVPENAPRTRHAVAA